MAIHTTEAIILKREDRGESDRLYTVFSQNFGKVKVLAQGIRKIKAKLLGHLEPFNLVWLEMVTKRNGQIGVTTALTLKEFLKTPLPGQVALAFKCSDLIDKLLVEPQEDDEIWQFLLSSFEKVSLVHPTEAHDFFLDFKKEFLGILGYGVDIEVARLWLGDFDVL